VRCSAAQRCIGASTDTGGTRGTTAGKHTTAFPSAANPRLQLPQANGRTVGPVQSLSHFGTDRPGCAVQLEKEELDKTAAIVIERAASLQKLQVLTS
jgi:hypothetical protein